MHRWVWTRLVVSIQYSMLSTPHELLAVFRGLDSDCVKPGESIEDVKGHPMLSLPIEFLKTFAFMNFG